MQFISEDLEHNDGSAIQASFHGTDDFISVHELWQMWIKNIGMLWCQHYVKFILKLYVCMYIRRFISSVL